MTTTFQNSFNYNILDNLDTSCIQNLYGKQGRYVFLVRLKQDTTWGKNNDIFIVKETDITNKHRQEMVNREYSTLQLLQHHPNIGKLIKIFENTCVVNIINTATNNNNNNINEN